LTLKRSFCPRARLVGVHVCACEGLRRDLLGLLRSREHRGSDARGAHAPNACGSGARRGRAQEAAEVELPVSAAAAAAAAAAAPGGGAAGAEVLLEVRADLARDELWAPAVRRSGPRTAGPRGRGLRGAAAGGRRARGRAPAGHRGCPVCAQAGGAPSGGVEAMACLVLRHGSPAP